MFPFSDWRGEIVGFGGGVETPRTKETISEKKKENFIWQVDFIYIFSYLYKCMALFVRSLKMTLSLSRAFEMLSVSMKEFVRSS